MKLTPVVEGVERLLAVPYRDVALEVDVLLAQFEDLIRIPSQPAVERKGLKALRDRLAAHRAAAQMQLFPATDAVD